MKIEWRNDPDAEKVIREFAGVDFSVEDVSFSEIDWRESANNCARLGDPLNNEKIEEYASAFRNGDVFPMVVVERSENGFIILGGNQRCNALKRLGGIDDLITAYVVDPLTSANRELIIRSLNSRHGWGSSKSDRIDHAVYLVEAKGVSTETAARAMMVSDTVISERIRCNNCRKMLVENGIKEATDAKRFAIGHLQELSRVVDMQRRLQLARCIAETPVTIEELNPVVNGIVNAKSSALAQKLISEASKTWKDYGRIKTHQKCNNKHKQKWLRLTNELCAFLETANNGSAFSTFDEMGLSRSDADKAMVCIAKITARFNCLAECERNRK